MSYEEGLKSISLLADSTLYVYTGVPGAQGSPSGAGNLGPAGNIYRFVKPSGTKTVGLAVSSADSVIGVLQNKPQVSNQAATVAIHGVSNVVSGAGSSGNGTNIAAGDLVTVDNYGRAIKAATLASAVNLSGSITKSGSTVTYTATANGYAVGDIVTVAGATTAANNGTFVVSAAATNTFGVVNALGVAETSAGTSTKQSLSGRVVGVALQASSTVNEIIPVLLRVS
jgi:hypothetical protein